MYNIRIDIDVDEFLTVSVSFILRNLPSDFLDNRSVEGSRGGGNV